MSTAVISAARVRVRVGRVPLPDSLLRAVTTVEVDQSLGRPAQLRMSFAAQHLDGLDLVERTLDIDVTVEGHDVALFEGTLVGVERTWAPDGTERATVRAADRLHDLTAERHNAAFDDSDAIAIAGDIVASHGLQLQAHDAADRDAVVHQLAETDLHFVTRLLATHGDSLTLRGETVHVVPPDGIGATIRLRTGRDLHELSIDRRLAAPEPTSISGWNGRLAEGIATADVNPLAGWMLDDSLAERLATAWGRHDQADQVVAQAVAVGDTRLRPGTPVELRASNGSRLGRTLTDSALVLTSCRHRIDAAAGYVTRWSTEPVDQPIEPSSVVCTLGTVVDVDDPDRAARVRVELVAYDDVVTDWMPVVTAGAGDGVGIVALPDVGASVVLIGPANDPGRGVVLGGLFGSRDVPGPPVEDGRSTTFIARLAGGGQLAIHDHDSRVVVENGAGSRLEMSPETCTLHSSTDMTLTAPGQRLVISADTIDFERA